MSFKIKLSAVELRFEVSKREAPVVQFTVSSSRNLLRSWVTAVNIICDAYESM